MSAIAGNGWKSSTQLKRDAADIIQDTNAKLKLIEFLVSPLGSGHQVPFGFFTLGFTKVLLPEIYVSGIAVNDVTFRELYPFIRSLYKFLSINGAAMHPAGEICKVVNEQLRISGLNQFQARPIDIERLLYGQALELRYWLDNEDLRNVSQAIQIVWRGDVTKDFPMVSTTEQLLVDYVPFGTPCPKPITGA